MSLFALLSPAGTIASQERHLIILAVSLMLIVAIPMFVILFTFARKYRAGNPAAEAKHAPNLDHNPWVTFGLWAVPITLISVLSVINWNSTHTLDPYQPIASNVAPLPVEVIALPWKFLFIYPEQGIATVNLLEFSENTPLNFELTADAPMSSFWIPQLGSQIYAMPAMSTQLHLIADTTGDFRGMDTEINGAGFSGMKFIARSVSSSDFAAWVASVKQASTTLDLAAYNALAAPSEYNPEASYASVDQGLYNYVVMKYMIPASEIATSSVDATSSAQMDSMQMMPGMQM
jgi:cytochrome o ubiquinol oxidase subunit II